MPASVFQPLSILLADSEPAQCETVGAHLCALGHVVLRADTAAEAMAMFMLRRPDLVLLDACLSKADKHALIRRAHTVENEHWTPVWLMAAADGKAAERAQITALKQGADDFLLKPVAPAMLAAKLQVVQRLLAVQRRLEEDRRRARAISDQMIDGVFIIDSDGLIQFANAVVHSIFGYELDALHGRNIRMLLPEPHAGMQGACLECDALAAPVIGVGEREMQGLRKGGSLFPIELGVAELRSGDRVSFIGIVRDISERKLVQQRLLEKSEKLQRYRDEQESEHELANDIMRRMMRHDGLNDTHLHHWVMPATHFSGDLVAGVRSNGKLYALLADATGHGLGAAISVLPVMMGLLNMAESGLPVSRIVARLNAQMRNTLPSSRFVAAALLCVDETLGTAEIWNGGMPDVLLLAPDGRIEKRLSSRHLALGIVDFNENDESLVTETVSWRTGCQFALCSDGLLEAANLAGEPFGAERFTAALSNGAPALRLARVMGQLKAHLGKTAPHDDISLVLVDCVESSCMI